MANLSDMDDIAVADDLLSVREVAELTGYSVRAISYQVKHGKIAAHKLPGATGAYVIRRSDVRVVPAQRVSS